MDMPDQRRTRRFELRLPLKLVRAGSREVDESVETQNLSSGGVLFLSDQKIDIGDPIEYLITLPSGPADHNGVMLHCIGKVVRRELGTNDAGDQEPTAIAATLERYEFIR